MFIEINMSYFRF